VSVVIDASVALKWVLDEPGKDAADALLEEELIAPSLWLLEAANALWRRTQRGEINGEEAKERLSELYNAPVTTTTLEYDCLYLAMAIRENTYVVTADSRFHAAVDRSLTLKGAVRMLGD